MTQHEYTEYRSWGEEEGRKAARSKTWKPGELKDILDSDPDKLGDEACNILDTRRQTPGSVYFWWLTHDELEEFQKGFVLGFTDETLKMSYDLGICPAFVSTNACQNETDHCSTQAKA